jgi:hypothetical protein
MKCYNLNNIAFIGCLTVNRCYLNKNLTICDSLSTPEDLKFWFRNSRISPSDILTNDNKCYTKVENVITQTPNYENMTDGFERVMGTLETHSAITLPLSDIKTMTSCVLPTGIPLILYGDNMGAAMLSKNNFWDKSLIIMAYNADSPIIVGDSLFYISPEGIEMKENIMPYIFQASKMTINAGFTDIEVESLQKKFDEMKPKLIGSGKISSQRISGYITHEGFYRIVYYNSDSILCCLEGCGGNAQWKMSNNF